MVEYVGNQEACHGSQAAKSAGGRMHPRSGYKMFRGGWWNTDDGT